MDKNKAEQNQTAQQEHAQRKSPDENQLTALERISQLSRFGSRLGLERMEGLLALLGNPQDSLNVIHVAGTNGKGSVSRYLYAVARAAGLKAGLYTSPFLERFHERIQFDGQEISDEDLEECTELVFSAIDQMLVEGCDSPTEFEAVTAIAFLYFQRKCPDVVVLEVGLGGAGDSTNVVKKPLACVITSISFDHMEQLGRTLPEIAGQKAGIIKAGVPVISFVKDKGADQVVRQRAEEMGSPLYALADCAFDEGNDISMGGSDPLVRGNHVSTGGSDPLVRRNSCAFASHIHQTVDGAAFDALLFPQTDWERHYPQMKISMLGLHQVENALCALTVLEVLRRRADGCDVPIQAPGRPAQASGGDWEQRSGGLALSSDAIYTGMSQARQPARMEVLEQEPCVILDGAHNQAGVEALRRTMETLFAGKNILLVIGMLADKEVERMTEEFVKISPHIVVTEPDNGRKLPMGQLARQVEAAGGRCLMQGNWREACAYIQEQKGKYDVTAAAGSLYLVGPMRGVLRGKKGSL